MTVIDGCQNGSVVKFGNSESKDSELCGFTIQNGSGTKIQIDDEYRDAGGGIWIRNSSPTVDHCIIKDNIAYRGGGIDCYNNCNPLITFCSFEYNEANEGGGAICCSLNCDMEIKNCNFYNNTSCYGGAFEVLNCCDPVIKSCDFENNYSERDGGAIYINHDCNPHIKQCNINNNLSDINGGGVYQEYSFTNFENCTIVENSSGEGGGLYCKYYANSSFQICTIANNTSTKTDDDIPVGGAGVFCNEYSDLEFINCIIRENAAERCGGAIFCLNNSDFVFEDCIIDNNTAQEGGAIYLYLNSSASISTSNICSNLSDSGGGFYCGHNSSILFGSAIIWGNQAKQGKLVSSIVNFHYSDLQNGPDNIININSTINWGADNIAENPLFHNIDNQDYSLYQESPCIDAGGELNHDPDGTREDIGLFAAQYETRELSNDVNWESLPLLHPNNANALEVLEPILDPDVLNKVVYEDESVIWYNDVIEDWVNNLDGGNFRSIDGYKINMYENAEIPVSGYLKSPSATIHLYKDNENWIGYFLPYSQSPEDAFANVWNNLTYIKADDWGMIRIDDNEMKGYRDDLSVDYGKLYVVGVERDSPFFTWHDSGNPLEEYIKTETTLFTFEENMDYMPVFVDSTDNLTSFDEIGVFLDNECIGASVLEEFPVFVPAYLDDDSTISKSNNELTFQVANYDKSLKQKVPVYVYNSNTQIFVKKPLKLNSNEYAFVRLGEGTESHQINTEFKVYQNYPNPLRSTTTFSFIIPEDNREAEINIYNIKGQKVKTIQSERMSAGRHNIAWNGRDSNNKKVSNGIYFYELTADNKKSIKKMLIMK